MKIKTILVGLFAGAIMLASGMLVGQLFEFFAPSLKTEYQNPGLFRPWSDPLMSLYFFVPLLTGIILALVWTIIKHSIRGEYPMEKGFRFGFVYWATTLPGMLMSYSSFPLSFMLVSSWSISGLVQAFCAGLLFSKMLK